MTVGYRRIEPPAPVDMVDRLELRAGGRLPGGYRAYLIEQDGGRLADNDQAVKTIFGVGDVPDWADLWQKLDIYAGRVPPWLLPVANDEYGNLFCLSLRQSDHGSVWFWDHEEEADENEPTAEDNVAPRAASWSAFLLSLQPVSIDDVFG